MAFAGASRLACMVGFALSCAARDDYVRHDEHVPTCAAKDAWVTRAPTMTESEVFGVGTGERVSAAVDAARIEAAKAISVDIRELVQDTQVLWTERSEPQQRREYVKRAATSSVSRSMSSCQQVDVCRLASGNLAALVRCPRKSELERALHTAARKLAALQLANAVVLAVPGSDPDGYISYLGEYAVRTLQDDLTALETTFAFARAPAWSPRDLHEVARQFHATHFLRAEHLTVEGLKIRFSIYLQDTTNDQIVPGSAAAFEVELSEAQASLLSVRGPLLPQHAGQRLASTVGDYKVSLRMGRTDLVEGQPITISFELSEGGYAYLYDIYEDGRATLLLPSRLRQSNYFEPGSRVSLPPPEMALIACPLGDQERTREYLKLVVSPVPLEIAQQTPGSVGLVSQIDGTPVSTMGELVRALEQMHERGQRFGTAELPFFIRRAAEPSTACKHSS